LEGFFAILANSLLMSLVFFNFIHIVAKRVAFYRRLPRFL